MLASISKDTDVFEVGDIGQEIVFMRDDMMFSMRKIPGEYMDTMAILKGITSAYTATTGTDQMKEALEILSAGAGNEPVNIALFSRKIFLCRNGEHSEANTTIAANITKETPEEGFHYNLYALLKLFQVLSGRIKIELDIKGFMFIKTKNEVYLQLPMRTPARKAAKPEEVENLKEAA